MTTAYRQAARQTASEAKRNKRLPDERAASSRVAEKFGITNAIERRGKTGDMSRQNQARRPGGDMETGEE